MSRGSAGGTGVSACGSGGIGRTSHRSKEAGACRPPCSGTTRSRAIRTDGAPDYLCRGCSTRLWVTGDWHGGATSGDRGRGSAVRQELITKHSRVEKLLGEGPLVRRHRAGSALRPRHSAPLPLEDGVVSEMLVSALFICCSALASASGVEDLPASTSAMAVVT